MIHGKSWKVVGSFKTFTQADEKRLNILSNNSDKVQVKVRRMADGKFVVKSRVLEPDKSAQPTVEGMTPKKLRQEKKRQARERRAKKKSNAA